jgi:hypothetical protein
MTIESQGISGVTKTPPEALDQQTIGEHGLYPVIKPVQPKVLKPKGFWGQLRDRINLRRARIPPSPLFRQ